MLVPRVASDNAYPSGATTLKPDARLGHRPVGAVPRSLLAAELSHDMRVPLSSIVACLEMLEDELGERPAPVVETLLSRAQQAADRMLRMLDRQMGLGPVSAGRILFDVDLGKVACQLADDSARILEMAGATLEIGRLPVVRADPDEMYSILQNLLSNAVKFKRPGVGPVVSISARHIPGGWRVTMTDNGIGIPEDRRTDVFVPFTRLSSDVEGHGIGLGTVAHTVTALGGRVGADEAPDGGAEVWFELPTSSDA